MVIGNTGVGKSTLVNYLSGSKLEVVSYTDDNNPKKKIITKYRLQIENPVGKILPGHEY